MKCLRMDKMKTSRYELFSLMISYLANSTDKDSRELWLGSSWLNMLCLADMAHFIITSYQIFPCVIWYLQSELLESCAIFAVSDSINIILSFINLLFHFLVSRWTDSYLIHVGSTSRKLKAAGGGESLIKVIHYCQVLHFGWLTVFSTDKEFISCSCVYC